MSVGAGSAIDAARAFFVCEAGEEDSPSQAVIWGADESRIRNPAVSSSRFIALGCLGVRGRGAQSIRTIQSPRHQATVPYYLDGFYAHTSAGPVAEQSRMSAGVMEAKEEEGFSTVRDPSASPGVSVQCIRAPIRLVVPRGPSQRQQATLYWHLAHTDVAGLHSTC